MKKKRFIEMAVKVIVAALTAFITALGTTSCMGAFHRTNSTEYEDDNPYSNPLLFCQTTPTELGQGHRWLAQGQGLEGYWIPLRRTADWRD